MPRAPDPPRRRRARSPLALLALLLLGRPGAAALPEEQAARSIDLRRAPLPPEDRGPFRVDTFKERYRYEVTSFRRLLVLDAHLRRCVDAQRLVAGEFHDRLDFVIAPSGKLERFSVSRSEDQLQACLLPHTLALKFPPFRGAGPYTLHVLVGSPGAKLGRTPEPDPVTVYPVETPEEQRRYSQAVFWVYSPWSMAVSHCAEWVDQSTGFGYKASFELAITPEGRATDLAVKLRGRLAEKAIESLVSCVLPFLRGMRVPPHRGPKSFTYRHGTSTAGWGIR